MKTPFTKLRVLSATTIKPRPVRHRHRRAVVWVATLPLLKRRKYDVWV